MKVKCINNKQIEDFITIGKDYEVIGGDKISYCIKGDDNILCWYSKNRFEFVKEDNTMDLTIEQKVESLENQIGELKEELHKAKEEKGETIVKYEIRYAQDNRNYITGILIKDIETARRFKHEYEKLNHISNVNIVKITEIKEEVE